MSEVAKTETEQESCRQAAMVKQADPMVRAMMDKEAAADNAVVPWPQVLKMVSMIDAAGVMRLWILTPPQKKTGLHQWVAVVKVDTAEVMQAAAMGAVSVDDLPTFYLPGENSVKKIDLVF